MDKIDHSILDNNLNDQVPLYDFFHAFGYGDHDQVFFRTFKDKKQKGEKDYGKNTNVILKNLVYVTKGLEEENRQDRGVYFIVNGGGNDDKSVIAKIKRPKAHFIDIDDYSFEEQVDKINEFGLEPSIIIKTKKSLHVYWLTDEDAQMRFFRPVQLGLIDFFKSDATIQNESRVMRLYGFNHCKGDPVMVKLLKFNPEIRYSQEELVNALIEHGITTVNVGKGADGETTINREQPKASGAETAFESYGADDLALVERNRSVSWFDRFCEQHSIEQLKRIEKTDGSGDRKVITSVLCPWADQHTDGDESGSIVIVHESGAISYKCQHQHCIDRTWKDYRGFFEEKAKAEELEHEVEAYLATSAGANLQEFINGITESANTSAIPTGFPSLDSILDGGLYEGLITVGATTSLGKTTLIMQMVDQVASAGYDALVFSLEMSRTQLMSKSISRHTIQIATEKKLDSRNAKTSRGITSGGRYAKYSQTEMDLIQEAIKRYQEYADHIFIQEGIGDITVERIRETVEKHILLTGGEWVTNEKTGVRRLSGGRRPLVVVDYLQIIAPHNEKASDKQIIDHAVLELKRISRDYKLPVIVISSFNRAGYKKDAEFDQFKESGAIEYSSDIAIALQYEGTDEKGFKPKEAKKKNPREIELVVLKNRDGKVEDRVHFKYYPMFNFYVEVGIS